MTPQLNMQLAAQLGPRLIALQQSDSHHIITM